MRSYFDTSVLVSLYVEEALTERSVACLRDAEEIYLSRLTEVEFYSAVARKLRMGQIDERVVKAIASTFTRHLSAGVYTRLHLTNRDFDLAAGFLQRFTTPLRTLDALHLACCSASRTTMVTADRALATSARILGMEADLLG